MCRECHRLRGLYRVRQKFSNGITGTARLQQMELLEQLLANDGHVAALVEKAPPTWLSSLDVEDAASSTGTVAVSLSLRQPLGDECRASSNNECQALEVVWGMEAGL